MLTNEQHLTSAELAKRWKCAEGTLRKHRHQGTGCPYRVLGAPRRSLIRYRLSDVERYEREHHN